MRFGSVCSGIEAASVAWHPIGWQAAWLAEIEPFPCAVLAHHYPDVPNLGDMTKLPGRILSAEIEAPDVFCGGTPCQAFSVAGERRSLDDDRGNLSLTFCEVADAIDHVRSVRGEQPAVVFWENVPGVLSTKDNAFGCFLAGLAGEVEALKPSGGDWTDAGCVLGPKRAIAWRVLDAQYFGLAQRRRRVFVVASAREGFDPTAVLFESKGVRRDTAPSREAWEAVAPTIAGCSNGGGANGPGRDVDSRESLQVMEPVTYDFQSSGSYGEAPVAATLSARDFKSAKDLVAQPVTYDFFNITAPVNRQSRTPGDPCHTLARSNAEHAVVISGCLTPDLPQRARIHGVDGTAPTLSAEHGRGHGVPTVLAFSSKDYGADAGEVSPTLRSMGHDRSHANGGGQVAIAFHPTQDPISSADVCHALGANDNATAAVLHPIALQDVTSREKAQNGRGWNDDGTAYTVDTHATQGVATAMKVRRLTPVECERLQGFPDDYTLIQWRNKPADQCPDGPRYKALGNSWAVPVVRCIGQRINDEVSK